MTDISRYREEMVSAGMSTERAEHILHRMFIAGLAAAALRPDAIDQCIQAMSSKTEPEPQQEFTDAKIVRVGEYAAGGGKWCG